jgi:hypothetical protein
MNSIYIIWKGPELELAQHHIDNIKSRTVPGGQSNPCGGWQNKGAFKLAIRQLEWYLMRTCTYDLQLQASTKSNFIDSQGQRCTFYTWRIHSFFLLPISAKTKATFASNYILDMVKHIFLDHRCAKRIVSSWTINRRNKFVSWVCSLPHWMLLSTLLHLV